jgi:hypothetical protein
LIDGGQTFQTCLWSLFQWFIFLYVTPLVIHKSGVSLYLLKILVLIAGSKKNGNAQVQEANPKSKHLQPV